MEKGKAIWTALLDICDHHVVNTTAGDEVAVLVREAHILKAVTNVERRADEANPPTFMVGQKPAEMPGKGN